MAVLLLININMGSRRYRWWHGVAFYLGIQTARILARASARKLTGRPVCAQGREAAIYESERLPVFAPPRIAFPIAWTVNTLSMIAGGLYVLNLHRSRARSRFLKWQGWSWLLFVLFEPAYFVLRSPINAAIVTLLYSGTTLASLRAALGLRGNAASASLLTTLAWLGLANPVGITQALWNRDEFWKTGAAMIPSSRWLK